MVYLLEKTFFSGFLQLLGQLTEVGNITKDQFLSEFKIYPKKCILHKFCLLFMPYIF